MTKYHTDNPVGSSDPRDLYDNAVNLDELVNSESKESHPDRRGNSRKTWHGMEEEFDADQMRREDEFQATQDDKQDRFNAFIVASGYEYIGDYAAGIEVSEHNQIIRDGAGEFWRASGSTALPYTTTGAGLPEGGAFITVGDAALRQDLVQPVATFNNVTDMKNAGGLSVGRKARTLGYYEPGDGGGNDYEVVAATVGANDDGSFINLSASGLQARGLFTVGPNIKQFGADGVNDNIALQALFDAFPDVAVKLIGKIITSTRVVSNRYLELEGDSKITGTDLQLVQKVLAGSFLDATDWSEGKSKYLLHPTYIMNDFSYDGDIDDFRKQAFGVLRYYNGQATAARATSGANIYAGLEYGFNSSAEQPATGTHGLYEGSFQVRHAKTLDESSTRTELTPIAIGLNCQDVGSPQAGVNIYNDIVMNGPRAQGDSSNRESHLSGMSLFVAKYAPGNDVDDVGPGHQGSVGQAIWTNPGGGGFKGGQDKQGWVSYELLAGLFIGGWAGENGVAGDGHSPAAGVAYESAIKLGSPGGTVWSKGNSKFRRGVKANDYTEHGILLDEAHPDATDPVAIGIGPDAGNVGIGTRNPSADAKLELVGKAPFTPVKYSFGGTSWVHRIIANGNLSIGHTDGATTVYPITFSTSSPNNMLTVDASNTVISRLKLTNLPSSSSGLTSGEVWSDGGTLKVVQ